jgi:hypothetical protein
MRIKAAIYARVSLKDGRQDVDNQLRLLREYATREGLEVVAEFVDYGSGGNGNRDQFRAMFNAAAKRRFSLLLFFSLDRLSREGTLQTLQYLQRLTACGVGYTVISRVRATSRRSPWTKFSLDIREKRFEVPLRRCEHRTVATLNIPPRWPSAWRERSDSPMHYGGTCMIGFQKTPL